MPSADSTDKSRRKFSQVRKATKRKVRPNPDQQAPARAPQKASVGDRPATRTQDLRRTNTYKKTPQYKRTIAVVKPGRVSADANVSNDLRKARAFEKTPTFKRTMDTVAGIESQRRRTKAEAGRSLLSKLTNSGGGKPLNARELRLDVNRDGRLTLKESNPARLQKQITTLAPALKILEQTTRPIHAVAGATDAAIQGKSVPRAALRGLQNKDKILFGKILRDAGVPGAGVLGAAADIALDPTTYLTFGAGSVAAKAAAKEAARVSRQAQKQGMSKEAAARLGFKAGQRKAKQAKRGSGVTVKFAGREVPAVRAATAGTARVAGATARKVTPAPVRRAAGKVGGEARNAARDVRPMMTPAGMKRDEFVKVQDAAASARAGQQQAREFGQKLARAVQKRVPDEADQAAIIRALETGKIKALPERLRDPAIRIRSDLRYGRREAVRSGVPVKNVERGAQKGEAKGYFPHALTDALKRGDGVVDDAPVVEGVGRKTIRFGAIEKRADRRPISTINKQEPGKFSEDLPLVLANHFSQLGHGAARARFNRALAATGREIKWSSRGGKDSLEVSLDDGEALYRINGSNIKEVGPQDRFRKQDGGAYFVLNKNLVDKELGTLAPMAERSTIERGVNRGTAFWKRVALATPAYHIRNAIGDTTMAYYAQPGHQLARNTAQAAKILAADRRSNKQIERLQFAKPSGKTVKVAGERVSVDALMRELKRNATVQTGYIGRELDDLVGRKADGSVKKVGRSNKVMKTLAARENVTRISTAKAALDKGMTPAQAARTSRNSHIDYGSLTTLERRLRAGPFPFWTFAARNIPIQAKALVQTPGKIANFEKLREEAAQSLGLADGWENDLPEYQARQLVIPIGRRKDGSVRILDFGLPVTSLNELPANIDPRIYIKELQAFGTSMLGPAFKIPIELTTGTDTFRRKPIDSGGKLVAAPAWAEKFGLTRPMVDPKTGKTVAGWSGAAAYLARQITPGPLGQANQLLTKGTNSRGQVQGPEKTLSVLTGARIGYTDKVQAELTRVFEELNKVKRQMKLMQSTPGATVDAEGFYTPEYEAVLAKNRKLNAQKDKLYEAAGRPKKPRGKKRSAPATPSGGPTDNWVVGGGASSPPPSGSSSGDNWVVGG